MQLHLETIAICNAACVFCPYPTMKRPRGTMSMDLFRKIIDEAATISRIEEVCLTGLGEPLLDRQVVERLRYVRKKMPLIQTTLYTNGSLLSAEKVTALRDAGLGVLYVSLNAAN